MQNIEQIKKSLSDIEKIKNKWSPLCKASIGNNEAHGPILELICLLCEYREITRPINPLEMGLSIDTYGYVQNFAASEKVVNEIGREFNAIYKKIMNLDSLRLSCEGSNLHYNILSNKFEYRLCNGGYIETDKENPGKYTGKIDRSFFISAFPDDFIKVIDLIEYRDKKINSIV